MPQGPKQSWQIQQYPLLFVILRLFIIFLLRVNRRIFLHTFFYHFLEYWSWIIYHFFELSNNLSDSLFGRSWDLAIWDSNGSRVHNVCSQIQRLFLSIEVTCSYKSLREGILNKVLSRSIKENLHKHGHNLWWMEAWSLNHTDEYSVAIWNRNSFAKHNAK